MGLGCKKKKKAIEYVMALNNGKKEDADYEIELPDEWKTVRGRTEELGKIYGDIYKDGVLLYEIEEFDDEGNCQIRYCR